MTKIVFSIDGQQVVGSMDDNAAARDFLAMLPMTMTLEDYSRTEKVSDLPGGLSTEGAPKGHDPAVGDITYYAPWGNLAIFYRDFGYASGLVRLGTVVSGIEILRRPGPLEVTVERVQ
ncbi:hypothetical protein E4634_09565 [Mangrovimicrobium sediminis]|uniref:Cyclophilin-like domain-containing protein n=1 Tax=Mangrovimicrobium sediminis TaxID=2562682 RepID=A0A4Z0M1G6_9GAMM|nr:cyclophilin-like fold protein [Haliea sp. SAOS-164]TGD73277.1 hypothetical protein E4634_09565 [Haliea sp. SAOS-164]